MANDHWEDAVYRQGRQLNLYPFDAVVSFVLPTFGKRARDERRNVRILDIGCGSGNHVWFLAREGFATYGIDASASAIDFARRRMDCEGLASELKVGDFAALPWPDAYFDAVIDRCSLTHNSRENINTTLNEVCRVIKPDGHFFSQMFSTAHDGRRYGRSLNDGSFTDFSGGYFRNLGVTFFASSDDVDALFSPRFTIESKKHRVTEDGLGGDTAAAWIVVSRPHHEG